MTKTRALVILGIVWLTAPMVMGRIPAVWLIGATSLAVSFIYWRRTEQPDIFSAVLSLGGILAPAVWTLVWLLS